MSSWQSHLLRPILWASRLAQGYATIQSTRHMAGWMERLFSVPQTVQRKVISNGDFKYEWLIPSGMDSDYVIFHIHGGGFVFPLWNPERYTSSILAIQAKMRSFLPEYRLAPEHPFPAAVEDCVTAYRWLINQGQIPPERIIFAGDSAGGNLVITTMLALRDAGLPLPIGGICISPVFDFEIRVSNRPDIMTNTSFIIKQLHAYQRDADPRHPLLAPIYADLSGLPPLFIQVGEKEIFLSGIEEFVLRAQGAGVHVTSVIWPGMWHFWHLFYPFLPEAREAFQQLAGFILNDLVGKKGSHR